MRGGVKFYRGGARGARDYVEADRSRADEYYLAEGSGLARRYTASGEGVVARLPDLAGDGYEAWVAGFDPDSGEARGRVRTDGRAVRFCEVVVNGPKTWSIAAELHPDVAAAYEAAQDGAAVQILSWLGGHASSRVGPRGGQVSAGVELVEAAVVRHYTSRGGDPHRHLHVQVNARVRAGGQWRGIDSVAVRASIGAVHGIGHAAVMTDPAFRRALAGHGYTVDSVSGEIVQLAGVVGAFSKRAAQIAASTDAYETQWREAHPGGVPGPGLRRGWDGRAWAEQRPGKSHAETAGQARSRWLGELDELGFTPPTAPVDLVATPVGGVDRDTAAGEVLARLTAARSAWNVADLRGEAELVIAETGIITDPAVRTGLARDITARAATRCVPLLDRAGVPEHVRAFTSREAVAVEDDVTGRLAVRGAMSGTDAHPDRIATAAAGVSLDAAQAAAVAALAGDHALVVVTGAAGAGKTTTLAATRAVVEADGRRLVVVTPTLKAARAARAETGAHTGSAAWLAFQYGWRRDPAGSWTRLASGQADPTSTGAAVYRGPGPEAVLGAGDLLVVDEAGMLDQDCARALLHVADEAGARVALLGDARQLPAVGRGGVLDLAARWAERQVTLDVIHRFTHTAEVAPGITADVPDEQYAGLSLAMRTGHDPGAVFDQLAARGQVQLHPDQTAVHAAVADAAAAERAAGRAVAVAADTREQAAALNTAIRDRLTAAGLVDDTHVAVTSAGVRVGVGDLIATRRNDRGVGVANRDTYTVTAVHDDGALSVTGPAGARVLPAGYVTAHVELGYACTVYGVQGDTVPTAHLVLGENTPAAAVYVGMTRGRTTNTVHITTSPTTGPAATADGDRLADARRLWIDAATRGRPDLGVAAARAAAERSAGQYATPTRDTVRAAAAADPARLAEVLDGLRGAWTERADAQELLGRLEPRLEQAQAGAAQRQQDEALLAPLRERMHTARDAATAAEQAARVARAELDRRAEDLREALRAGWDGDRPAAASAAGTVAAGPGRFARITGRDVEVAAAGRYLQRWADKWRPVLDGLPAGLADPAALGAGWHAARVNDAIDDYTQQRIAAEYPQQVRAIRTAETARETADDATDTYTQAAGQTGRYETAWYSRTSRRGNVDDLNRLEQHTNTARHRLAAAEQHIHQLTADPAITEQPDPDHYLTTAHTTWTNDHTAAQIQSAREAQLADAIRAAATRQADQAARQRLRDNEYHSPSYRPDRRGPSISR